MRAPNLWIRLAWSLLAIAPWVAAQDQDRPAIARSAAPAAPQGVAPSLAYITHQSGNSVSVMDADFNAVVATVRVGSPHVGAASITACGQRNQSRGVGG